MNTPHLATVQRHATSFLSRAAHIARRRGMSVTVKPHDLGDFFHVFGRRGTPTQFVAMLGQRGRVTPPAQEVEVCPVCGGPEPCSHNFDEIKWPTVTPAHGCTGPGDRGRVGT